MERWPKKGWNQSLEASGQAACNQPLIYLPLTSFSHWGRHICLARDYKYICIIDYYLLVIFRFISTVYNMCMLEACKQYTHKFVFLYRRLCECLGGCAFYLFMCACMLIKWIHIYLCQFVFLTNGWFNLLIKKMMLD